MVPRIISCISITAHARSTKYYRPLTTHARSTKYYCQHT